MPIVSTAAPLPPGQYHYSYDALRAACVEFGIACHEEAIPAADQLFHDAGLTPRQVDAVTRLYAWNIAHYFKPSTYTCRQRLALAWHFLFGRG